MWRWCEVGLEVVWSAVVGGVEEVWRSRVWGLERAEEEV